MTELQVSISEPLESAPEHPESNYPRTDMMSDDFVEALFGAEFLGLWLRVRPHTMVSEERAYATYKACKHVCIHDIPGDFVECGVFRGGMSLLASLVFKRYSSSRRLVWLFDTFAGMPPPDDVDMDRAGVSAALQMETDPAMCFASLETVRAHLATSDYAQDQIRFVKGDVVKTLQDTSNLPDEIAVLRLDTDWYDSTRAELDVLYPRLTPGGVGLIDDYGHWLGARKAVDEFLDVVKPPIYVSRTDSTGIEFVKPRA